MGGASIYSSSDNVADIGAVVHLAVSGRDTRLERADYINVIAGDNVAPGKITEGRVQYTGCDAEERIVANSGGFGRRLHHRVR